MTQNYLESEFNMAIRSSRQPCDHNPWKPLTPRIGFLLYSRKIDWMIGNIDESKMPTNTCNSQFPIFSFYGEHDYNTQYTKKKKGKFYQINSIFGFIFFYYCCVWFVVLTRRLFFLLPEADEREKGLLNTPWMPLNQNSPFYFSKNK